MSDTRTQQQTQADAAAQAENPFAGESGDLAERIAAYERVARAARAATERGDAAAQALEQRRNRSGQ